MTTLITHFPVAQHTFARPPSPQMESHVKCTLPSISNLLGLADAGSPTNESSPTYSPRSEGPSRRHSAFTSDSRPGSGYGHGPKAYPHPPRGFPPSPPLGADALDSRSPIATAVPHFPAKPVTSGYYHETTPPLEADLQRHPHHAPPPPPAAHGPLPPYSRQNPPPTSNQPSGSYFPSSAPPPPSAAPPTPVSAPQPPTPGMTRQRPLPQAFPPVVVAPSSGAISWQHHHYLQPSSGHLFPQSQDRYICQTCNKAFSRPSSLRIHSHSHTGEKPFKCSQAGCGKAFSVRSNMKRHERGCHSVEVKAGGPMMS
jgi:hypothetical protein